MSGDCFNLGNEDVGFCRSSEFDLLVLIIVKSPIKSNCLVLSFFQVRRYFLQEIINSSIVKHFSNLLKLTNSI